MNLKQCTFIVLDTETTGTDPHTGRIIELAAVKFGIDGKIRDTFETLLNPGIPVPAESTAVHKITDSMLEGKPAFRDVAEKFRKFAKDAVLVGHNVSFDIAFINSELERAGLSPLINTCLDTLMLSRKLVKGLHSYRLGAVARHFNVELENAHRALYDVYATKKIFMNLLDLSKAQTLEEISKIGRVRHSGFRGNYFIFIMCMYILGIAVATKANVSYEYWQAFAAVSALSFAGLMVLAFKDAASRKIPVMKHLYTINFKHYPVQFLLMTAVLFFGGMGRYCNERDLSSPTHISKFAKYLRGEMVARISEEPDIKFGTVRLILEPLKIKISDEQSPRTQNRDDFPDIMKHYQSLPKDNDGFVTMQPKSGLLRAFLYNTEQNPEFFELERGDTVWMNTVFMDIDPANNPGGFDNKIYHNNQNIYSVLKIRNTTEIERRGTGGINPVVDLALNIKVTLLKFIKKTVPYPQSSFLGGVMLGLKSGLTKKIEDDARASGVGHVFAVSGLHVTIITFMFYGIFSLMKINNKYFTPVIFFLLILFSIITGARPSTLRAAIMNSLVLLFYVYLADYGLRSSILLGLATSAVIILTNNPLMLVDPSFALSFMAILSLGMLTTPVESFLKKYLTGLTFWAVLGFIFSAMLYIHFNPDIVQYPFISFYATAFLGIIAYLASRIERKGLVKIKYGFRNLPGPVSSFLSAQCAIFFGMMGPLSAFYFHQTSISAPFANLIAIPMIGVIVQLGFIGGMIAMLPYGIFPAFLLSAGNYVAIRIFLDSSSFFAENWPFPVSPAPTFWQLMVYFGFVAAFIYRYSLGKKLRKYYEGLKKRMAHPERFVALVGVLFCIAVFVMFAKDNVINRSEMKTIFFDVRYGSSAFLQCPGGKSILVDGGYFDMNNERSFPVGERTIMPTLSSERVLGLDTIYLTSLNLEHLGGLLYIADHFYMNRFVDMFGDTVYKDMAFSEFCHLPQVRTFLNVYEEEYVRTVHMHYMRLVDILTRKNVPRIRIDHFLEYNAGPDLVINGLLGDNNGDDFSAYTYALQFKHGKKAILYGSDIDADTETTISKKYNVKSDVLVLADHGGSDSNSDDFLKQVNPKIALAQYSFDNYNSLSDNGSRDVFKKVNGMGIKLFTTMWYGAIIVTTDSDTVKYETLLDNEG